MHVKKYKFKSSTLLFLIYAVLALVVSKGQIAEKQNNFFIHNCVTYIFIKSPKGAMNYNQVALLMVGF